jgi:hypothetical protein
MVGRNLEVWILANAVQRPNADLPKFDLVTTGRKTGRNRFGHHGGARRGSISFGGLAKSEISRETNSTAGFREAPKTCLTDNVGKAKVNEL